MATGVEPRTLLLNLDCIRVIFASGESGSPRQP